MANQGMLTESLSDVLESERWVTTPSGEVIEFIQEPQVSIEEMPMFMEYSGEDIDPVKIEQSIYNEVWSEAEIKKSEEIAAAGKAYWDAVLQGAIDFLSGDGMMSKTKPKDEGRRKPVKIKNLRGAKPGYSMAEGSNFWSVDEKDSYWQTKQGYEEAINLYGTKPGWVKEPSLEYNPTTGEYDSTMKEEFVDLKPTKRISL